MSIAPRKCLTSWKFWPGQPRRLGQIVHTESGGFTVGVSQIGQRFGGRALRRRRPSRRWISGAITCGITSPARVTTTSSRSRTSLRARSSSLCRVAVETVTPPTCTGSSIANGSSRPVRPTFQTTRFRVVVAVIGGNFHAIAQRGSRPVTPSSRQSGRWSTLTTTPSISKSSDSRRSSHHRQRSTTSSALSCSAISPLTAKPCARIHSSSSEWLANSIPSCPPIPYDHIESGRDAVTSGSSWRIVPAVALRGFANVDRPSEARCSLSSANAPRGK